MDLGVKTNIYVDGFNLYYGCLRGTPYRWLDLAKLCSLLLPSHQVNRIRYFTAPVNSRPDNPFQHQRQLTYLRALGTIPNLSIHHGHFLSHPARMSLTQPPDDGPRTVEVLRTAEKGTDVNLATYLLIDAFNRDCEMAVLLSNDSDFKTPIEFIRSQLAISVGVFSPQTRRSRALSQVVDFYRPIRRGPLSASQFPDQLRDARGVITKPNSW